VQSLWPSG